MKRYIQPLEETFIGTIIPSQSGSGSNINEVVLHFPLIS